MKAKEISSELNIPEHFLAKILTQLVRKKYICSSKGPSGGVSLAIDPNEVTLFEVLESMDGLFGKEEGCMMGFAQCCPDSPCAFHDEWLKFKENATAVAQKTTLLELARKRAGGQGN